jgi:hypothetical protein
MSLRRDGCVNEIQAVGPAADWNRQNPALAIQTGDRVVSANGISGSRQEIVAAIQRSRTVDFVFARRERAPK